MSAPGSPNLAPTGAETDRVIEALGSEDTTAISGSESPLANRRSTGRVHWGSDNHPAQPSSMQIGGQNGPRVTLRAPSGTVQRANHPGPLNLGSRIGGHEASTGSIGPLTAPAEQDAGQKDNVMPQLVLTGARGLDAEGLDNRAFLELQRELQRHEAQDDPNDDAASWNAGRTTALEAALQTQAHQRAEQRRRRGSQTPDWAASGASTPGGYATSDSGSYDAAADSDLDHIDIQAGETDGMPSKPKRKKGVEEEVAGSKWGKLRTLLFNPAPAQDVESAPVEKAIDSEGGPTNTKSVPVTTSSGVHQGPRGKPTRFEREAAKLIRAHKLMTGRGGEDSHTDVDGGRIPTFNRQHLDSEASTPDPLETSARMDARPLASGGVLGNLMKLYEQQQKEEQRARGNGSVSGVSTPDVSSQGNFRDMVSNGLQQENEKAAMAGSQPLASPSGVEGADRRPAYARVKSYAASSIGPQGGAWAATGNAAAKVVKGVADTGLGLEDVTDERPKAARSAGGVVGGLIATTGNLIGAVSPYHAQLGPNPKRPGYTLDRYLLPEMNAKTLKRTAEAVATAAPKPYRRSQSQPGTPGGVRSPGAGMGGAVMTRKDTNGSSDTRAGTPSEKHPMGQARDRKSTGNILNLPGQGFNALKSWTTHSNINTPDPNSHHDGDYFGNAEEEERLAKAEWQKKLRKRAKDKRKKEEIFITMHVAAILQRQEFLLKLSRALMMFGAPTHRIETQIQQTARVLEINCRCIYFPNLMLFAFGDEATHTSEIKFIKQGGGLDFTKLTDMHTVYWNVVHDKIGVSEASAQLDELMRRKPLIGRIPMVIIGGCCSAFICVGPMGFNGSFIDAIMAWPLGAFLVYSQSIITTEIFSNVFEIIFASLNSFIASAVASTGIFCYAGVVSGSIVLILPGFIVLSGSLELQSKNLIAGSVRLVYAIIYSLFLGFGLSIGASLWALVSGGGNTTSVTECSKVHDDDIWWRADVGLAWAVLTVPMYSMCLSLRNQAKINRKEFPAMVLIACAGWACNHFASTAAALDGRQDITSALGSLAVGLLSNLYGRIFDGRTYVVAATGVLYQLPSGLSNGGLLNFAQTNDTGTDNFSSGFDVAESLVEVALGLTVGLFAATIIAYALGGRKQRVGGLFSF